MNVKLQTAQTACAVQQRFLKPDSNGKLSRSDSSGKLPRTKIRDTLSLLMDVADASIISPWRRLKTSEALVGYLVSVVAEVGALHDTAMFRILLLRFKALLLAACAQVRHFMVSIHVMLLAVTFVNVTVVECHLAVIEVSLNLLIYVIPHGKIQTFGLSVCWVGIPLG